MLVNSWREKHIDDLLARYSDIFPKSKRQANDCLSDSCMAMIEDRPFRDIVYIYKQVLLRYQLEVSFDYVDAANNLKVGRSTLAEMRRTDKGNMLKHMPYGGA